MILVGDIGATKTILALYSQEKGISAAEHEVRFESTQYSSLEAIIAEYLNKTGIHPVAACFGVAGPVTSGLSKITNLPWSISADNISKLFNIPKVSLLNDLQAIALAVPHLDYNEVHTLNRGEKQAQGNILVVAPGTGLGVAFLVWTGEQYKACASEGGHIAFSPRNQDEIELLKYLQQCYDHVSFERICSGSFLPNIYNFLLSQKKYSEPLWLKEALQQASDPTPLIVQTALDGKAEICQITLDIFIHTLGTIIGNMAVTLLPTAGIYLGGGIPPRILKRLQQADFISSISDKGRFTELTSQMPVYVIKNPKVALQGAAWSAMPSLDIC